MITPMSLTVQTISDDIVTLASSDGQTFRLPSSAIHGAVKVGMEVKLIAAAIGSPDGGTTEFARAVLQELLPPNLDHQ